MFIRLKKSSSRKLTAVQLVEGVRDPSSGKVKQRVIRHIGSADNEAALGNLIKLGEFIKAEISDEINPSLFKPETMAQMALESSLSNDNKIKNSSIDDIKDLRHERCQITGIHDIYGKIFDQLGFNQILYNPARQVYAQKTIKEITLARIANPQSKRETINFLENNYGVMLKLDSVYNAMGKINEAAIDRIQKKSLISAQTLFKEKIDVLFYDVTTLYFESFTEDALKSKGYSKDNKFNEVQVMLSIFVTSQGIPIGYEVFPGSTYEGHTLLTALNNLKTRFEIDKVVFVADSGMLNDENISLLEEQGYEYIVGARIKNLKSDTKSEILNEKGYIDFQFDEEKSRSKVIELGSNKKLIISYSPKRARKEAKDREASLEKLYKKMKKSKKAKSLVNKSGYKKYLIVSDDSNIEINDKKIAEDSRWDGLRGVITNAKNLSVSEVLSQYKGLWQVEETFRVSKKC